MPNRRVPLELRRRRDPRYLWPGLIIAGLYGLLPASTERQWLLVAVAVTVPLMVLLGTFLDRPHEPHPWMMFAAGSAIVAAAEVGVLIAEYNASLTWSTRLKTMFVVGALVQIGALLGLIRTRLRGKEAASWLDAISIGAGVLAIAWELVTSSDGPHGIVEHGLWLATPVMGIALIVLSLRLQLATRTTASGYGLLTTGFVLHTAGTVIAAYTPRSLLGQHRGVLSIVGYVLIGAACVRPARLDSPRSSMTVATTREARRILIIQAVSIACIIVAGPLRYTRAVDRWSLAVWICVSGVVLFLNRIRLMGLLNRVASASASDYHRRLSALVEHSHEVVGLIDRDGTVKYVSPAIERMSGRSVDDWVGKSMAELAESFAGLRDAVISGRDLGHGGLAVWEGQVFVEHDRDVTLEVTVANHLDTPEVEGYIFSVRDRTAELHLHSELRRQALHDSLTDLPNRTLLSDRIEHALERFHAGELVSVCVLIIDVDDFKTVNDTLGHAVGDELIVAVSDRLREVVPPGNTVARLGGDEFAVLLEDLTSDDAAHVADDVLGALGQPFKLGGSEQHATASIGFVRAGDDRRTVVDLLRAADIAMYAAKRDGKGRVKMFDPMMQAQVLEESALRHDLTLALESNQLSMAYQPIVDMRGGGICGFEALMRWNHPHRGWIPPGDFIPIAERNGLMDELGEWALRTSCAEAAGWTGQGATAYVSVNVASEQLIDPNFGRVVSAALHDTGLAANRLMLELTERSLVEHHDQVDRNLAELREMGVRLAIDDFGTGYSSLSYLKRFDVDVVKIDRAFVNGLAHNSNRVTLTKTILALAESLEMTAIAEGVESVAERHELERLGCLYAQGFLFSRPVFAHSIPSILEAAHSPAADTADVNAHG